MGTSLPGGGGRARPGCLLDAIEALIEQANAQTLHDHGDTSFFVNLADTDAMARVQDGEAQGLAQAGITAIDFTAGQVRYADGHSDALTAQLLTGETSGVKLTKVYEVVDGQQVDLHAATVCYRFDSCSHLTHGSEGQGSVMSANDFEWRDAA